MVTAVYSSVILSFAKCIQIIISVVFIFHSFQPAYHSKKNEDGYPEACSCAICPLKTEFRGPADGADPGF
jgi:hypothetical protein